ncbi:hypothetical protein V3W47_19500 [Deinococcus sp. YIM 134068]|uniref:hypothetical protein n=1 Tax=Deinococcus lichenicola TaxID=3118910 RepID=UPI002F92A077
MDFPTKRIASLQVEGGLDGTFESLKSPKAQTFTVHLSPKEFRDFIRRLEAGETLTMDYPPLSIDQPFDAVALLVNKENIRPTKLEFTKPDSEGIYSITFAVSESD